MPSHTTYAAPTILSHGVRRGAGRHHGAEPDGDQHHLGHQAERVAGDREQRVAQADGQRAAEGEQQARAGDLDEEERGDQEGEPLAGAGHAAVCARPAALREPFRRAVRERSASVQADVVPPDGAVGLAQRQVAPAYPLALEARGQRHPAGGGVLGAVVELDPLQPATLGRHQPPGERHDRPAADPASAGVGVDAVAQVGQAERLAVGPAPADVAQEPVRCGGVDDHQRTGRAVGPRGGRGSEAVTETGGVGGERHEEGGAVTAASRRRAASPATVGVAGHGGAQQATRPHPRSRAW